MTRHLNWLLVLVQPTDGCHQSVVCDSGQLSGLRDAHLGPLELFLHWQIHQLTWCDFSRHENHDGASLGLIDPRLACFSVLCNRLSIYRQNRSCP
jgi:hypothetical protein